MAKNNRVVLYSIKGQAGFKARNLVNSGCTFIDFDFAFVVRFLKKSSNEDVCKSKHYLVMKIIVSFCQNKSLKSYYFHPKDSLKANKWLEF